MVVSNFYVYILKNILVVSSLKNNLISGSSSLINLEKDLMSKLSNHVSKMSPKKSRVIIKQ